MQTTRLSLAFLASSFLLFFSGTNPEPAEAPLKEAIDLSTIQLPSGFQITQFATGVTNARAMAIGDKGTIFVGSRRAGKVYAVVDANKDYKADEVIEIASGLNMPSGLAFRSGSLYVAEVSQVIRFDNIENTLKAPPKPVVINDEFPSDRHHGWKYLGFGPDGKLYVPVGAPCNICLKEEKPIYATMTRMNPDGSNLEIYASGIRNSVGFDWHPKTGALWFTDNGRDMLGDDLPPDELNCAPKKGMHFGYPFCHGGYIADPEFGSQRPCTDFAQPARNLHAHAAAIGMTFYRGSQFPETYRNRAFIAEHGSWNRSKKAGYRIMTVATNEHKGEAYEVFAEGWLENEETSGRPADVLELPDGSLLVSDDFADCIYRISYRK